MPQVSYDSRLIDHRALAGFCTRLLMSARLVESDARLVADTLVEANLRGVDSHGAARLHEGIPLGLHLLREFDELAISYGVEKLAGHAASTLSQIQ